MQDLIKIIMKATRIKTKLIEKKLEINLRRSINLAKDSSSMSKEYTLLKHLLLEHYGLDKFSYLDLGCHDAVKGSFTYSFYKSGSSGACVDANPVFKDRFKKFRPKDKFINAGVTDGTDGQEKDFYIASNKVSSSFSKEWMDKLQIHHDAHIEKKIKVKLRNINSIIHEYFDGSPDLLLLDLEGLDFEVIKSMDFNKYRPKIIMAETCVLPYEARSSFYCAEKVAKFLKPLNYHWFTKINENSVFVDMDRFNKKGILSLI